MRAPSTAFSYLVNLLLICVVVEFAFLRVLLRSGPALGGGGQSRSAADLIVITGHTAMNLGVVVALLLLGVLCWRLHILRTPAWRVCAIATAALALTVTAILLAGVSSPGVLALTSGLSIVVVACALYGSLRPVRETAVLALFGSAYLAIYAYYVLQSVSGMRTASVPALPAYYLGELMVVLAAFSTLLLVRRPWSWKRTTACVVLGAGFLAARAAVPWLVSTIGIWNFGVTMSLPALVYGLALICVVTAVLHVWPVERFLAVGLILMVLGGMKLDVVYFHLLGLTGFLLMTVWLAGQGAATSTAVEPLARHRPRAADARPRAI
jgi:hypothetical protein